MLIYSAFKPLAEWPRPIEAAYSYIERFRIVNGYGLFRVMTKTRPEIAVEGSSDGVEWKRYRFRWKPGDLDRAPTWCAPHQPRLDWQMWFAAMGSPDEYPWTINLVWKLLHNDRAALSLFAANPFPDKPPRFIRATWYRYKFVRPNHAGVWWEREELGPWLPPLSADNESLREVLRDAGWLE